MAKKTIFKLAILKKVKDVEDGRNFVNSSGNSVPGERDISYRSSQELKALVSCTRDATIQRVDDGRVERGARVDERLVGV